MKFQIICRQCGHPECLISFVMDADTHQEWVRISCPKCKAKETY